MLRKKKFKICVLSVIVLVFVGLVFSPFIYTLPALNSEILGIYTEWIQIAKDYQYNWTLRVRSLDNSYLRIDGEKEPIISGKDCSELEKYFPDVTSEKYQQLVQSLVRINCCQITKKDNVMYFIVHKRLFSFCNRPGIAYSLDGSELSYRERIPAVIENVTFEKLEGNWYISKDLLLLGRRLDIQYSLPSSVFDFSMSYKP